VRRWLLLFLLVALPARAQGVDLQLVLAVDASGSVSAERFALQREGYAAAFRDARVVQAIKGGMLGRIAVAMVQWTGPRLQVLAVDWQDVHDAASAEALAARIAAAPRQLFRGGTSLSGVIDYALPLFDRAPFPGTRRVIDISGDGANNAGRPAAAARDEAVAAGITINGLPILNIEPDLDGFYRDEVIGGPGAFMIAISTYDQFAAAILRKLITEIAARDVRGG
jgi:hypothetical protein